MNRTLRLTATPEQRSWWERRASELARLAVLWTRSEKDYAPGFAALHARLAVRYRRLLDRTA